MTPDDTNPTISAAPPEQPAPPKSAPRATRFSPWLLVAVAALGLAGWQWYETRHKLADMQAQVARRLAESDAGSKEDRGVLKQMREQVEGLQGKAGVADARLAELATQSEALQALYQELARGRDDSGLLEAEQAIVLAGQQLQFAGNVPAAILALRTAQTRLASVELPQALPLRQALARDLERLTALPAVDVAGTSIRIEQVLSAIDKLPLVMESRPQESPEQPAATQPLPWWQRTGREIWQELRSLVRIQRYDREEAVLLAPGQGFFLRENLKLRLLNARLALLSRDQDTFHSELKAVDDGLTRHFDGSDKGVQAAQETLRELAATEVVVAVPQLTETQAALTSLHGGKDRQ